MPYVVYAHGMMDPYFARIAPMKFLAKRLVWFAAQGSVLHHADRVLFTSRLEQRFATRTFPRPAFHSHVVAYGAKEGGPRDTHALSVILPRLDGRRYLLYLGRIHEKKGGDLLIDAFAQLAASDPALDLVMAGPEPDGFGASLRQRARSLGIDHRIHWPGMISGAVKAAAFQGAEAFVLPSHQENFGIAVAEALSHGCPVLISDQVNIFAEIRQANAGLVAPDTPEGVSRLLTAWAATPPQQRALMARNARQLFQKCFTPEAAANDLDRILHSAIETKVRTMGKLVRPIAARPVGPATPSAPAAGPSRRRSSAPHPARSRPASPVTLPTPNEAPLENTP